jgi:propanol-preferring alcohol dehydrogenase
MRAMVLRQFGEPLLLERVPDPACGPDDVILQVAACGVCATDLKIGAGKVKSTSLPHILGHEIAGVVAEVGADVSGLRCGDHVCAHFYVPCLRCPACRAGRTNICVEIPAGRLAGRLGFEWWGGYAEFVRVPARVVVGLPRTVNLSEVCIAADAIATPYHALRGRAGISAGETIVLLGAGGLGLHGLQIARATGVRVIVVEKDARRREVARELGADEVVDSSFAEAWDELLGRGRFADAVVDFAGAPSLGSVAMSMVRPGGRYVIVGYQYDAPLPVPYQPMVSFEMDVLGSRASTVADLQACVDLILEGKVRPITTEPLPLEEANEALETVRRGLGVGRVVLSPLVMGGA